MAQTREQKAADAEVLAIRWRKLADAPKHDTDAQTELAQIRDRVRKLGRCVHNCPIVEIDVPPHSTSGEDRPVPFAIANASGRTDYLGRTVVPRCVAHTLLAQIGADRAVEQRRMTARKGTSAEAGRLSDLGRAVG